MKNNGQIVAAGVPTVFIQAERPHYKEPSVVVVAGFQPAIIAILVGMSLVDVHPQQPRMPLDCGPDRLLMGRRRLLIFESA